MSEPVSMSAPLTPPLSPPLTTSGPAATGGVRLVLASTSPRRRQLLAEAGLEHEAMSPGVNDAELDVPRHVPAHQWACALAHLKARSALRVLGGHARGAVIIGADTVVVKDGRILGQPASESEAGGILRELRDGCHVVITGVAILSESGRTLMSDSAGVRVGPLSDGVIDRYVASGGWKGKAGGYNLSERLAEGWPISFEGDAATIMGFPVARVAPRLRRLLAPDRRRRR